MLLPGSTPPPTYRLIKKNDMFVPFFFFPENMDEECVRDENVVSVYVCAVHTFILISVLAYCLLT